MSVDKKPTDLKHWSEERIRGLMFHCNKFFRKQLQEELSWRYHNEFLLGHRKGAYE